MAGTQRGRQETGVASPAPEREKQSVIEPRFLFLPLDLYGTSTSKNSLQVHVVCLLKQNRHTGTKG